MRVRVQRSVAMLVTVAIALEVAGAACGQARASEPSSTKMSLSPETVLGGSVMPALTAVLTDSARAWTRGDLDGFMRCYEGGAGTTYLKSEGVVQGFAAIRAMYAPRFAQGETGRRGELSTELSEMRALGADYALAIGRFRLIRAQGDGGNAAGVFTLVFHKGPQGWRIISDHTS